MKSKLNLTIDILLLLGIFCSMSLQNFGPGVHKLIGLVTFLLFVAHNVLNWHWYGRLFRGKYTPRRLTHTAVNLLTLLAMLGQIVLGCVWVFHVLYFVFGIKTLKSAAV